MGPLTNIGRTLVGRAKFNYSYSLPLRKLSGLNQRPLDESSASKQIAHKFSHLMKWLVRPGRGRSLLVMFGAYLIFAFSMYSLKTTMTVDELKVQTYTTPSSPCYSTVCRTCVCSLFFWSLTTLCVPVLCCFLVVKWNIISSTQVQAELQREREERAALRELLAESDVLPRLERRIRADRNGALSLREEVKRLAFPSEEERDGR